MLNLKNVDTGTVRDQDNKVLYYIHHTYDESNKIKLYSFTSKFKDPNIRVN